MYLLRVYELRLSGVFRWLRVSSDAENKIVLSEDAVSFYAFVFFYFCFVFCCIRNLTSQISEVAVYER